MTVADRVARAAGSMDPPATVTREQYDAITCNRCGMCCVDIPAPETPDQMAALLADPATDDDTRAFVSGLVPVKPIARGWTYRCRHHGRDPEGRATCAVYDSRPSICRRYPQGVVRQWSECSWYVRVDDPTAVPVTLGPKPPSVAPSLEAFYDELSPDERAVMDVIVRRAAAHVAQQVPIQEEPHV